MQIRGKKCVLCGHKTGMMNTSCSECDGEELVVFSDELEGGEDAFWGVTVSKPIVDSNRHGSSRRLSWAVRNRGRDITLDMQLMRRQSEELALKSTWWTCTGTLNRPRGTMQLICKITFSDLDLG